MVCTLFVLFASDIYLKEFAYGNGKLFFFCSKYRMEVTVCLELDGVGIKGVMHLL